MKAARKLLSDAEKTQIVLEAIKGKLTTAQISSRYGVYSTQISDWKQQAIKSIQEGLSSSGDNGKSEQEPIFKYLESIAEFIPAPFYWMNTEGRFIGLNQKTLEAVAAAKKEDVIGKNAYELYKDKAIGDVLLKDVDELVRTGKISIREDKILDVKGRVRYFSATRAPLKNKKNEIIGLVGTSIEITAEKEAERLKIENIRLEAENKLTQVLLEKLAAETKAEQLRLENETYLAQKKEQAKFLSFIDKIQRDIQNYKVEALTEQIGIKPKISNSDKQIRLTKRELDILYYLSLNKSPKDISQIITIIENKPVSDSTINAIINKKLYPKFEVFNIGQLVEKAIMLNQIPFLLNNLSD